LWYHQHIIGHHAYINVAMKDPDIAPSSQIKREHQIVAWKKIHAKQGSVGRFALIWIITNLWLNLINDLQTNINLSYNNVVGYNVHYLIAGYFFISLDE
jgi:delta11-fatty-acid desaturase